MKKLNQVENITPLSVAEQTQILGGKGWLKKLFRRYRDSYDDSSHHNSNHNHSYDDGHRRRRGRRG